ncbi:hypothetical protein N752_00155 [Desulforamulus aquiferis]|nr:hypothetical protein N752_00155 [Desulforamulus aquiferis]
MLLCLCLLVSLTGNAFAAGFSDMNGHWAENQVNKWATNGLAGGYQDGTFKPDAQVTRLNLSPC